VRRSTELSSRRAPRVSHGQGYTVRNHVAKVEV
jgi:hypothetical protein